MWELKEYYKNFDSRNIKGDIGEVLIAKEFRKLGLTVIRNVYIPIDNFYTEIDMVVIDNYGNIFVVEVKNFSGFVDCNNKNIFDNKYWLNITSSGKVVYFLNPYKQNEYHCLALRNYLGTIINDNIKIMNLVIFTDKAKLSTRLDTNILVERKINTWYTDNIEKIVVYEMKNIIDKLIILSDSSEERKSQHIRELEERRHLCKKR